MSSARGLFITGTDTEVGKTYIASLIARRLVDSGYRVGVYKPVVSGLGSEDNAAAGADGSRLWEAAGRPGLLDQVCPQCFAAPLAPSLAAHQEGKMVDEDLLIDGLDTWRQQSEIVVVEGIGGLMSPVTKEMYTADLAHEFGFPLVVVAPNTLGVINQTIQTLIAAATFRDGLEIAGIVLNDVRVDPSDVSISSNRGQLELHCVPRVVAHVSHGATVLDNSVDWFQLAK